MNMFRDCAQKLARYFRPREDDIEQAQPDPATENVLARLLSEVEGDPFVVRQMARRLAKELEDKKS